MVKLDANDKSGLSKLSSADRFQIRSVAQERFISKLGVISAAELNNIKKAVTKVLSLDI
jgi:mRNA interferase MazF